MRSVLIPSPDQIDAYLRACGWAVTCGDDRWKSYVVAGFDGQVWISQRSDLADYALHVQVALAVVAKWQKRPEPWELVAEAAVLHAGRLARVRAMEGGE